MVNSFKNPKTKHIYMIVIVIISPALLFSATFRKRVEKLARDILADPVRVVQGEVGEVRLLHC